MIWLQFILCVALIGLAGIKLSRYGDIIADKTGLGGTWVGLVMSAMNHDRHRHYRPALPPGRLFKRVGWVGLFLFSVYLLNSYMVFIHGE